MSPGFSADRNDTTALAWTLVIVLALAIAISLACFFWFDRRPARRQFHPALWLTAPHSAERDLAKLEQPEDPNP